MNQIDLKTFPRTERGKGPARRLRASGKCPATVYGGDKGPESVAVDTQGFEYLLHHGMTSASLLNLTGEGGGAQLVVLRSLDRDPISYKLQHLDFYRVSLDKEIEYEIPVHPLGTSPGVRAGGIMEHTTRTVHIRCLPTKAPQALEVSIENLDFTRSIHMADVELPEGVTAITDLQAVLFSVVVPRAAVSAADGAEGAVGAAAEDAPASAEPEVIGKGKKEEEE